MQNVEDLYPLTPMQRTMLLHALTAGGADTLFHQFCYAVEGHVDPSMMARAWRWVVARHPALRTAFVWDGVPDPLQVVRRTVEPSFECLDWCDLSEDAQAVAFEQFLARDRAAGFAFDRAPLMRWTLCQRSESSAWFVWSSHHLILDRWCVAVVLSEFDRCYRALRDTGEECRDVAPPPFRSYVQWVQERDLGSAVAFWREQLSGIAAAQRTTLAAELPGAIAEGAVSRRSIGRQQLAPELALQVRSFARAHRVTPNTIFQAAWALWMARRSGRDDVVFGATVAGRPPELAGVESIVGSFISNVPVRVRLPADLAVGDWLTGLQRQQQERARCDFLATSTMHECSGLPAHEPLFDSLMVWLAPIEAEDASLPMRAIDDGAVRTAWPLTVSIADRHEGFEVVVDCARGEATVALDGLEQSLLALLAADSVAVGELARLDEARSLAGVGAETAGAGRTEDGFAAALPAAGPGAAANGVATVRSDLRRNAIPESLRAADVIETGGGREEDELEMVQAMLLEECRRLLGNDSLGLGDNFFEAGGTSLMAAALHARIESMTGRRVPLLALFQAQQIGEMAAVLARRDWPLRAEMVRTVQVGADRPPLLCVASPEVNSVGYVLLARHLHPDQPVDLVQLPPSANDVLRMTIREIPELSRRYLEGVRAVRPHGPYRLLGMCDGGLLAVEMAKLLVADGEEVEFVGILNTFSLNTLSRWNYVRRAEMRLRYYGRRLRQFGGQGAGQQWSEFTSWWRRRFGGAAADGGGNGAVDDAADRSDPTCHDERSLDEITREWQNLDWPGKRLLDAPYSGKVTLFRIGPQPYFRIRDDALGWRGHAAEVDVIPLTESPWSGVGRDRRGWRELHLDILREPEVRKTAAAVAVALERCARR